jgi:hypothetical protein
VSFSSPLGALILVFAITAGLLIIVAVFTLFLSIRHRQRLQDRVYQRILEQQIRAGQPSDTLLGVLTADDLRLDLDLREEVSQIIVGDERSERRSGEDEGPEDGSYRLDLPPSAR